MVTLNNASYIGPLTLVHSSINDIVRLSDSRMQYLV